MKQKKKTRFLAWLVAVCMVITMIPCMEVTVHANTTEPNYLTFTAEEANSSVTLKWQSAESVEYRIGTSGDFSTYTEGTAISLSSIGDKVQFRGKKVVTGCPYTVDETRFPEKADVEGFSMTGKIAASGSVTSLTDENGAYSDVTLSEACYSCMFYNCGSLTVAPELPATTVPAKAYEFMFAKCTNLKYIPSLPATELTTKCYQYMFYECSAVDLYLFKNYTYQIKWEFAATATEEQYKSCCQAMFMSVRFAEESLLNDVVIDTQYHCPKQSFTGYMRGTLESPVEGSGTKDDPYIVTTQYQLDEYVQKGYVKLGNDIKFEPESPLSTFAFVIKYEEPDEYHGGIDLNGYVIDLADADTQKIYGKSTQVYYFAGLYSDNENSTYTISDSNKERDHGDKYKDKNGNPIKGGIICNRDDAELGQQRAYPVIYVKGGKLIIEGGTFYNNKVCHSIITADEASYASLSNVRFCENTATINTFISGLVVDRGNMEITGCKFDGNKSDAGVLCCGRYYYESPEPAISVSNSEFTNNTSDLVGPAIDLQICKAYFKDITITGNALYSDLRGIIQHGGGAGMNIWADCDVTWDGKIVIDKNEFQWYFYGYGDSKYHNIGIYPGNVKKAGLNVESSNLDCVKKFV